MQSRAWSSLFAGAPARRWLTVAVLSFATGHESFADAQPAKRAASDEDVVVTTVSSTSSVTYAACFDFSYCDYDVVLADGGDFQRLELSISGDGAFRASYCNLDEALAGAVLTHQPQGKTVISKIASPLAAGARLLSCSGQELYDEDNTGEALDFRDLTIVVTAAFDRNEKTAVPPRVCAANVDCQEDHCNHSEYLSEPRCGDAVYNGYVSAADSLLALQTSVGASACEPFPTSCDADGNGSVTASDALAILRVAVGQSALGLSCPMPCND